MRLRLIALLKARPDRKHEAAAALLTNHIVTQLRANGNLVRDEDLARVSPLFRPHITPSGSYFPFAPKPDSGGRADRNLSRPITLREIRYRTIPHACSFRPSRGRSAASADKSLVVAAVEKVPPLKNKNGKHGHAVKRQHGLFAGNARIAVLPAATGAELGAFLTENVAAASHLLTGGVIKDQQVASSVYLSVASARWQPG